MQLKCNLLYFQPADRSRSHRWTPTQDKWLLGVIPQALSMTPSMDARAALSMTPSMDADTRQSIAWCHTAGTIDDPIDGRPGGTIDDPIDGRRHKRMYCLGHAFSIFLESFLQVCFSLAAVRVSSQIRNETETRRNAAYFALNMVMSRYLRCQILMYCRRSSHWQTKRISWNQQRNRNSWERILLRIVFANIFRSSISSVWGSRFRNPADLINRFLGIQLGREYCKHSIQHWTIMISWCIDCVSPLVCVVTVCLLHSNKSGTGRDT